MGCRGTGARCHVWVQEELYPVFLGLVWRNAVHFPNLTQSEWNDSMSFIVWTHSSEIAVEMRHNWKFLSSAESKLTVIGFGIFLSRGLQSTWYFGIGSSPVLHLSNLDFAESVILCLIHIFKTFASATCKPCTTVFDYNFTMQIYPHFCSF